MQALTNVQTMDWRSWRLGIIVAFISGGAGSIGSFVGVETVLDVGLKSTLLVMAVAAGFSSFISLGKFLQTHPIPEELSPITIVKTVIQDQQAETTTEVVVPEQPKINDKE